MKFGIIGNLEKKGLGEIVQTLIQRFTRDGVDFFVQDKLANHVRQQIKHIELGASRVVQEKKLIELSDTVISLGGDGTILRLARSVAESGKPILGVNLGKLGFLAEVSVDDLDTCLNEILEGKYVIEERSMLQASISHSKRTYAALNDIVVDKFGSSRVLDFETYVNGEYLATFAADGVIFSTPTGSTAYALANGGPIVPPTNKTITISPICPHTLTVRPVIVPDDAVITLKIAYAPQKLHITADGQDEVFVKPPIEVNVKKAPFSARLIKRLNTNYYDVLRKKLQWGRDVRNIKSGPKN